jgi:hypothetical protein
LRSLLALFSRPSGPVLEDYPHDSPVTAEMDDAWSCALPLPPLEPAATPVEATKQAVASEVGMLAPWYAESVRKLGRSAWGLSGLSVDQAQEAVEFLVGMAAGEDPEPPAGLKDPMPGAIRFMVDDLKSYYMEAVNQQPGAAPPGGVRMWTWFYHETRLGPILYDLRDRFAAELKAKTEANGGQPPPGPPPPNIIVSRFSKRPESQAH